MIRNSICIGNHDYAKLQNLISSLRWLADGSGGNLGALEGKVQRAKIVPSADIPSDVVTMNTTVLIRDLDSGEFERFTLVFPPMANWVSNRVSILAPIGIAVLGCRQGDEVECPAPAGIRRFRIENVLDQTERVTLRRYQTAGPLEPAMGKGSSPK